ncbi:MAG: outer membrane protein assembly factor BamA [candidate division Zixibacteria bacterium RBG_16_43_9]|nr:MAG: outer membrane protein assembly factor BamA [candidate division Zixibacteria bacterium RBG_16_43_9]
MKSAICKAVFYSLILTSFIFLFEGNSLSAGPPSAEKPVIKKIEVYGNTLFSAKRIKQEMSLKENKWYNLFKKQRFYKWKMENDRLAVDSLYHINGFLQAQTGIDYQVDSLNQGRLRVNIFEGVQTKVKGFTVKGGLENLVSKQDKELSSLKPGEPLNLSQLGVITFNLKTIYANNGYPYCSIKAEIDISQDSAWAQLNFEIEPGKMVRFGDISVEGLSRTHEKVARRELTIKSGEIYSREKILDSEQRAYSTGLFTYVSLDAKNSSEKPENPDFVLKLVERKPSYVGVKLGLGQYQPQNLVADLTTADLTLEWGNRNLAGTARKISLSGFSSFVVFKNWQNLTNRFKFGFVEPWLFGTRTPFNFDLYYEPGVKSVIQPYRIESYGGNFNFSREYRKFTKFYLTFSYQQVKVYDIPSDTLEEFKREQGINIRRKMDFAVESDTRPNPFVPASGSYFQLFNELVGGFLGGDNHFYKLIWTWSRYNTLGKPNQIDVLATRVKLGYVQRLSKDKYVPTFDRFYAGGAYTIRGYSENTLGPKDIEGKNTGGGLMLIANSEIRKALFWKFGYTVFLDAGNIWAEPKNFKVSDIRLTGGVGLQFFTPIGPIRLDYARRILRDDEPAEGMWHLAILYAF